MNFFLFTSYYILPEGTNKIFIRFSIYYVIDCFIVWNDTRKLDMGNKSVLQLKINNEKEKLFHYQHELNNDIFFYYETETLYIHHIERIKFNFPEVFFILFSNIFFMYICVLRMRHQVNIDVDRTGNHIFT